MEHFDDMVEVGSWGKINANLTLNKAIESSRWTVIFMKSNLLMSEKRKVYKVCVWPVYNHPLSSWDSEGFQSDSEEFLA